MKIWIAMTQYLYDHDVDMTTHLTKKGALISIIERMTEDLCGGIDEDEMENGEGTFWYVMLDPLFEPTANVQHTDYLWLNIWGNKEDKDSGYARYAETDLQAQADMFSTCQRFPHSGRVIR